LNFVKLDAGSPRVTWQNLENDIHAPGKYKLTLSKLYAHDDRKDGGAWTGWTEPVTIEFEVEK
jgi:hypothetical protein